MQHPALSFPTVYKAYTLNPPQQEPIWVRRCCTELTAPKEQGWRAKPLVLRPQCPKQPHFKGLCSDWLYWSCWIPLAAGERSFTHKGGGLGALRLLDVSQRRLMGSLALVALRALTPTGMR